MIRELRDKKIKSSTCKNEIAALIMDYVESIEFAFIYNGKIRFRKYQMLFQKRITKQAKSMGYFNFGGWEYNQEIRNEFERRIESKCKFAALDEYYHNVTFVEELVKKNCLVLENGSSQIFTKVTVDFGIYGKSEFHMDPSFKGVKFRDLNLAEIIDIARKQKWHVAMSREGGSAT